MRFNQYFRLIVLLLGFMVVPVIAAESVTPPFSQTFAQLQKAILVKDFEVLRRHVDLENIVRSKINKFTKWGDFPLARLADQRILDEYAKSRIDTIQYYYRRFRVISITQDGDRAAVCGTFMREAARLNAIFTDGRWIVVSVESPIIDREFENLLKNFQPRATIVKKENILSRGWRKLKRIFGR